MPVHPWLREAIEDITNDKEFKDLHKFRLNPSDWDLLKDYEEILQVPHAFQDILSGEKTPTLCYSIPAFASFIDLWKKLAEDRPEWEDVIQSGLDKLEDYQDKVTDTYDLAMGNKLEFYCQGDGEFDDSNKKFERAKKTFIQAGLVNAMQSNGPQAKFVKAEWT